MDSVAYQAESRPHVTFVINSCGITGRQKTERGKLWLTALIGRRAKKKGESDMAVFTVNGQKVEPAGNQKLLRFLRDELHLTSVKDGCSEGACGACTVIIDGKTCKACVPDTDLLDGRTVITVEGLTEWEREVYTYAYGKAGAVQCGFCIPGMVMCTKALLDVNKEPTDDEIKYALRNNYCRCTGYVKIMDAVRLAAKVLKAGVIPDDLDPDCRVFRNPHRHHRPVYRAVGH